MNQGRHTRRGVQQAQAKHPALVHFIHKRILPHLRQRLLAQANRVRVEQAQAADIVATEGASA